MATGVDRTGVLEASLPAGEARLGLARREKDDLPWTTLLMPLARPGRDQRGQGAGERGHNARPLIQLFDGADPDIERIAQRPGLGPGQRHPGKMRLDAELDILRGRVRRLCEDLAIRKGRRGFR